MGGALAERLLEWYDAHGRVLPFRGTKDPYRIWLSEIMLQQTRTETVASYYNNFLAHFPDVFALASAREEDVLKCWEGLGYYSRARNLHKAAQTVVSQYGGVFPADYDALRALPGIGDYTAAAVGSIAFDLPLPALDGNLTRVLSRVHGIRGDVGIPSVHRELLARATEDMPKKRCGDFNQALMDLGATVCVPGTPDCDICPLRALCDAYDQRDADLLPVRSVGKPPQVVHLAVVVTTCGGKTLLYRRKEHLLQGLWVFPLLENAQTAEDVARGMEGLSVKTDYVLPLGHARHVFTHRIWEMDVWHCHADAPVSKGGLWVTTGEMNALPMPTAVRAAKEKALDILQRVHYILPLSSCGGIYGEKQTEVYRNVLLSQTAAAYSESWQGAHRHQFSDAFWQEQTPAHMEMILRVHIQAGHDALCLMMGDEVAGVMVLDRAENEIISLYIRPRFQNQGLGRAALTLAEGSILDRRRDMRITALQDNPVAQHLYRAVGFSRLTETRVLNAERNVIETDLLRLAEK